MSSTKIVIIVLVLIGLLFVIFVARGALRSDPQPSSDQKVAARKEKPPNWTKTIKGLFSSLQPGLELKQKVYSADAEETVKPDDKQAFRTATFHRVSGSAEITYEDKTPLESGSPLKKMDNPQKCKLPQDPDPDISDRDRCAIVAFKRGGKFSFACTEKSACRVEVE